MRFLNASRCLLKLKSFFSSQPPTIAWVNPELFKLTLALRDKNASRNVFGTWVMAMRSPGERILEKEIE